MVLRRNRFGTYKQTVQGVLVTICKGCPFFAPTTRGFCVKEYKNGYNPEAKTFVSDNCNLTEVIWCIDESKT